MANIDIEIHGLGRDIAEKIIKRKIFQLFKKKPYYDEITVSIFDQPVVDKNEKDRPFIRVFSDEENIKEIIDKLMARYLPEGLNIKYVKYFLPNRSVNDLDDDDVKVDKSIVIKAPSH